MRFQLYRRRYEWSALRSQQAYAIAMQMAGPRVGSYANSLIGTYRIEARGPRANVWRRVVRRGSGGIWGWERIFSWCEAVWGSSELGWWVVSAVSAGASATATPGPVVGARGCISPWLGVVPGCSWRRLGTLRSWTCRSSSAHVRRCRSAFSSCPCQRACYNWDR